MRYSISAKNFAINSSLVVSTSVKKFAALLIGNSVQQAILSANICAKLYVIRNFHVESITALIFAIKVSASLANGFLSNLFTVLVASQKWTRL